MQKRPLLMARKFLQAQGRAWEDDPIVDYYAFRKELYFFYGSLMDPSTLAHLLELRDQPQLQPSKIISYSCMLWGQYPALLDGPAGAVVYGMVYEVQTQSEKEHLGVLGRTFLWDADRALLKEGTFDLKDRQMDKLG
jgi:gamma-glutamylcyclotransferase (GGCT)/AIG2-like uncharacterized protein YtfP